MIINSILDLKKEVSEQFANFTAPELYIDETVELVTLDYMDILKNAGFQYGDDLDTLGLSDEHFMELFTKYEIETSYPLYDKNALTPVNIFGKWTICYTFKFKDILIYQLQDAYLSDDNNLPHFEAMGIDTNENYYLICWQIKDLGNFYDLEDLGDACNWDNYTITELLGLKDVY